MSKAKPIIGSISWMGLAGPEAEPFRRFYERGAVIRDSAGTVAALFQPAESRR